jgi:hypothetical protein
MLRKEKQLNSRHLYIIKADLYADGQGGKAVQKHIVTVLLEPWFMRFGVLTAVSALQYSGM